MFYDTDFLKNNEIFLRLDRTSDAQPDKGWVPAYYFTICLPDGTKIGQCDLRIGHNFNTYYGGNIGYGIYEEYRGHHYAGKACLLLFDLARKHDLKNLIITCDPGNIPSRKTCEYAGGVLEQIADIPKEHDLYEENKRTKICIYRFAL